MSGEIGRRVGRALCVLVAAAGALQASPAASDHNPSEILGTWRGTSTCSDRVAAPGCHDETVVYEFTAGAKPGTVRWQADKMVEGQRQSMGEMELVYDAAEGCWAAEFTSPRVHMVWCLVVDGSHLTGTGRLLPGKETVRRIDVRKE